VYLDSSAHKRVALQQHVQLHTTVLDLAYQRQVAYAWMDTFAREEPLFQTLQMEEQVNFVQKESTAKMEFQMIAKLVLTMTKWEQA
jgi:hypothetical protein